MFYSMSDTFCTIYHHIDSCVTNVVMDIFVNLKKIIQRFIHFTHRKLYTTVTSLSTKQFIYILIHIYNIVEQLSI
jgi:hypothetical protein